MGARPKQGVLGALIRQWRRQRRVSQVALAEEAGISARHLSFIECNKSSASREVLERLISSLQLAPVQAELLISLAGYSPPLQSKLNGERDEVGDAWQLSYSLAFYEPMPAMIMDGSTNVILANKVVASLCERFNVVPVQFQGKDNVLLTLASPSGLRQHILNWQEIVQFLLWILRHQKDGSIHPHLERLEWELAQMPGLREVLRGDLSPRSLAGCLWVEVAAEDGAQPAVFAHTSTSFSGREFKGRSQRYRVESFLPVNPAAKKLTDAMKGYPAP